MTASDAPTARAVSRWLIAGALVVLAILAHEGVRRCGFLGHDDDLLVSQNPIVRQGLTLTGLRWAFAADLLYDSRLANYWTPLAVLSHMLVASLFGMSPAAHHLANLALHLVNVALAFFVFARLTCMHSPSGSAVQGHGTGASTRSTACGAFVALVLAVHPVHVEAVAWVSQRKDVLSGTFWLLALGAYLAYVRNPTRIRMAAVSVLLALGLMAKPMLITFPFALLLLDGWPLGRAHLRGRLVREKWPLFLLTLGSVGATVVSNLNGRTLEDLPLAWRLANAVHAYGAYLRQALWPAGLGVAYPHTEGALPLSHLLLGLAVLLAISAAAVLARRRHPYLLVGWCWFLGTLVPALGVVVQSGSQGWADRFMYVPMMGLSLAVAGLAGDWVRTPPRLVAAGASIAVVASAWLAVSRTQTRYWTDDLTLFGRAAAVSPASPIAHVGLAAARAHTGDLEGAEAEYREALRRKPDLMFARLSLSTLLALRGRADESRTVLREAIAAAPDRYAFERGLLAAREGRAAEAMQHYAQAIVQNPRHHSAFFNWGNLLAAAGRMDEAVVKYREAARLDRDDSGIANNLGLALLFSGHVPEALDRLRTAILFDPQNAQLRTSHGLALSAAGRHTEAEAELREALRLDPQSADARDALAAEQRRR